MKQDFEKGMLSRLQGAWRASDTRLDVWARRFGWATLWAAFLFAIFILPSPF